MGIQPTNINQIKSYEVDKTRPVAKKARGTAEDQKKQSGYGSSGDEADEGQTMVADGTQNDEITPKDGGEEQHILDVRV